MRAFLPIEIPDGFKKGDKTCPMCLHDCWDRRYCKALKPIEGSLMRDCNATDCPLILRGGNDETL